MANSNSTVPHLKVASGLFKLAMLRALDGVAPGLVQPLVMPLTGLHLMPIELAREIRAHIENTP